MSPRRHNTLLLGAIAVAALAIVAALIVLGARREPASLRSHASVSEGAARLDSGAAPVKVEPAAASADAGPVEVRGWEGIGADGALGLDAHRRVRIDLSLRRWFDHFNSARGVLTEDQILDRLLLEAARRGFDPSQQQELRQLFESYRRYQASLATLQADGSSLGSVRDATAGRQQLRRAMLGAVVAEAFFALDEAEENYALARMAVMQEQDLSPAQRAARLAALLDSLPAELRAMEQESRTLERLDARVAALGDGADPATLYAARSELVGAEAARRLAELDAEEAAWQARMLKLQQESRRIRADRHLDASQQQRALDAYIAGEFTPQEALRARAHPDLLDGPAAASDP